MYLILGIIGVIVVLAVEFLLSIKANFTIMQFMIFNIPIGAYFIGILLGGFLSKGVKISGRKLNFIHYITAFLLALGVFYGTQYQWYKTTYIHEDGTIDGDSSGTHVDQFEYIDEDKNPVNMNLREYLYADFLIYNPYTSFENNTIVLGNNFKELFPGYALQVLSVLLTTIITLISITRSYQYCENCKKYYKTKKIFDVSQINLANEISELKSRISTKEELYNYVRKNRENPKENTIYRFDLEYCSSCNTGYILVRELEKQTIRFSEIIENRKTIDIDKESIEQII